MSRTGTFFSILIIGFSNALFAQDTAYNKLSEVVVTANKMEQKQNTTGKVITVLNKELIQKSIGKTLPQLLNEQAGIVVNGALNNMGSVQTVYMRGASSGRTLVLLDGIPVNDPSMINNEFDVNLFSLHDIERIEICKGAQSTLYGSDAVAGVINIITIKKDSSKAIGGSASLLGGSYKTDKENVQLYGKEGKLSYTARYARMHSGGFSSATDTTRGAYGKFDNDGYDGSGVNARLTYDASKTLSLTAFGLYSRYKAAIDAGVFTDDKDYTLHNGSFITGSSIRFNKTKFTVVANYQFSEQNRHYVNDSLDKTTIDFENNQYASKTQFAELYGNVKMGKYFTLLLGSDYRFSSYHQLYVSVSSFGLYTDTVPSRSLNQKSLYASLFFSDAKQKLNLEGGGRINHHSIYGANYTYTFNPSYSITHQFRIFGSLSSGYKAPGIYQLFDTYSGNKNLKAEVSTSREMGASFSSKTINARVVYFNRTINNGIDYNYVTYQYFNYIKQKVNGSELELTFKPTSCITVNANYTYLSPKETSQNRITNTDTVTYSYLLRRPNHMLNTTFGVQATEPLYISFSGKYVSSRYDVGGYQKADVKLSPYFLLSAYAEYKIKMNTRFFVSAQNLFNTRFYDVYGYNSIPFLVNGGVSFSF